MPWFTCIHRYSDTHLFSSCSGEAAITGVRGMGREGKVCLVGQRIQIKKDKPTSTTSNRASEVFFTHTIDIYRLYAHTALT